VIHLQAKPELRGAAEVGAEAHRGIRRDGALAKDNIIYSRRGDVQVLGQPVAGKPQRLHELGLENLAGMNRVSKRNLLHGVS